MLWIYFALRFFSVLQLYFQVQFECKIIISEKVEKLVQTMAQNDECPWWWMINLYPFFYQSPPTLMSSFSPLVGKINLHYIIWTIYFQHFEKTYFHCSVNTFFYLHLHIFIWDEMCHNFPVTSNGTIFEFKGFSMSSQVFRNESMWLCDGQVCFRLSPNCPHLWGNCQSKASSCQLTITSLDLERCEEIRRKEKGK